MQRHRLSCLTKWSGLAVNRRGPGPCRPGPNHPGAGEARQGAAAVDQILLLAAMFSLGGVALWLGSKLIDLVYEYVVAWVGWPF